MNFRRGFLHFSAFHYVCMECMEEMCELHDTAVLFLEFWKRRQFYLQYDWDMLGYESAEVSV